MSDYDGDEQWDIFIVSPKTGQVVNLTKRARLRKNIRLVARRPLSGLHGQAEDVLGVRD